MSDQGSPAPRRALPPLDDVDPDLDDAAAPPRRRLWEATDAADADAVPTTPIPPPAAPVLPVADTGPAFSGRRFSAADLPDAADSPLPRRSALSPIPPHEDSPGTPDTPPEVDAPDAVAAVDAPDAPDAVDVPDAVDRTDAVDTTEAAVAVEPVAGRTDAAAETRATAAHTGGSARRRRALVAGGVAALAVTGIVAAILLNPPIPAIPAAEPTVDASSLVLSTADVAALDPDAVWTAAPVATRVEASTPQASCLGPADDLEPRPASSTVGLLTSAGDDAAAVLHQMDAYATPEEAASAFALRREQLAACEATVALLQRTYAITGLGDEAVAVDLVVQGASSAQHHLVLSRIGSLVNVVDTSRPDKAFVAADVAAALAGAGGRQCTAIDVACPAGEPVVEGSAPLPTEPPGWLTPVDLPRITAGQGVWRGTGMEDVQLPSSTCDAVDLDGPDGASLVAQRTYLLTDDADASENFGIDQGLYTFADAKRARAFADKVADNVADCPDRMPTASVKKTGEVDAAGAEGVSYVVSQKLDDGTARYRITVLARGEHALYLFSNPGDDFDFSDRAWAALSRRAAERLAQLP